MPLDAPVITANFRFVSSNVVMASPVWGVAYIGRVPIKRAAQTRDPSDNTEPRWATPLVFRPTQVTTPGRQIPPITLVEALDREWRQLVHSCSVAATCWLDRHDALAPCQSLDDVLWAAKVNPNPVLAALLPEVFTGDRLAG